MVGLCWRDIMMKKNDRKNALNYTLKRRLSYPSCFKFQFQSLSQFLWNFDDMSAFHHIRNKQNWSLSVVVMGSHDRTNSGHALTISREIILQHEDKSRSSKDKILRLFLNDNLFSSSGTQRISVQRVYRYHSKINVNDNPHSLVNLCISPRTSLDCMSTTNLKVRRGTFIFITP